MQRASAYAKENRPLPKTAGGENVDTVFLVLLLLLLGIGLVMLYSASCAQSLYDTGYRSSTRYLQKQAVCAAIGLLAMAVLSHIPAVLWQKFSAQPQISFQGITGCTQPTKPASTSAQTRRKIPARF